MITDTLSFLGFATEFMVSGSEMITSSGWHGTIMLALVVGNLAVQIMYTIIGSIEV